MFELLHTDLLDWLEANKEPRFHAVLSDPPYFLGSITKRFGKEGAVPAQYGSDGAFQRQSKGFMGKTWDGFKDVWEFQAWCTAWGEGLLRVVYPGTLGLFFGGTRTYHRLTAGLEDAGWDIIDQIMWMYGSGFPKSHNVEAHGTALKPSFEPVIVARAPRGKLTFKELYEQYGTGLFNIDGARVATDDNTGRMSSGAKESNGIYGNSVVYDTETNPLGRWPANVILDEEAAQTLDAQSGELKNGGENANSDSVYGLFGERKPQRNGTQYAGDSGGASRFFYTAKVASWEREAGLDGLPEQVFGRSNEVQANIKRGDTSEHENAQSGYQRSFVRHCTHPTVKPVTLATYLAQLLLPPDHVGERRLLVPFAGVGSEMIGGLYGGWESVTGIEREQEYVEQGRARLTWWSQWKDYEQAKSAWKGEQAAKGIEQTGQLDFFSEL